MSKQDYIMWSDGVFHCFGKRVTRSREIDGRLVIPDGSIYVQDPVTVVFNVKVDENGKALLNYQLTPWLFRALLVDSSKNIWKINPANIIDKEAVFNEDFIKRYEYTVMITEDPRKKLKEEK